MRARAVARRVALVVALGTASMALPARLLAADSAAQTAGQSARPALPSWTELQSAGARVGRVTVVAQDVFDTSDPEEDRWLFRWANRLHLQTRPEVIERALLFKTGDVLSLRLLEETERLLRSNRYLYDVRIVPVAWRDGVVDIEVRTQDTWSLEPGLGVARSGGTNSSSFGLREHNLLGTGTSASLGFSKNVDRSGTEFSLFNERAFGSAATIGFSYANNSDGRRSTVSVQKPFMALDTRWAAGVSALQDDRIEGVYERGELVSEYRHRQQWAELQGGWSRGLQDGWVQRTTVGLALRDDEYGLQPGRPAPPQLAADRRQLGPFVRQDWIEDRVLREVNRNLVGKPEFFALGMAASVRLGWAAQSLGSSRDALTFDASISRGFEPTAGDMLVAAARVSGQRAEGAPVQQRWHAQLQYYRPQGPRWLFYGAASVDLLAHPDPNETLQLGGDNGLRGYPLRYQSGLRRALFTAEERFYTDLFPWRLFRLGGAAFVDVGRAWGGVQATAAAPAPWLSNAGAGLRIVSARAAFSNVVHVDLAVPLNTSAGMKKVQILVKTKASF